MYLGKKEFGEYEPSEYSLGLLKHLLGEMKKSPTTTKEEIDEVVVEINDMIEQLK